MIISPDAAGQIDGSVQKNILAHLPELPVDIVPISWFPSFVFKPPATTRYVLIDFLEPHSANEEYNKFWSWVIHNPPILTFRRELKAVNASATLRPIEWPAYLPIPERATKENFMARRIEVLYFWGYSNASRPKLHGDIFSKGMAKHGLNVISEWGMWDLRHRPDRCWTSIYTPHWRRETMDHIAVWMQNSKITVSLPGNGQKTFRDTECVGTLMAIQRSDIAYSYPWDESNSIQLTPGDEFNCLLEATKRDNLYDLYVACDQNIRRYEAKTYANDYVEAEIRKVL